MLRPENNTKLTPKTLAHRPKTTYGVNGSD